MTELGGDYDTHLTLEPGRSTKDNAHETCGCRLQGTVGRVEPCVRWYGRYQDPAFREPTTRFQQSQLVHSQQRLTNSSVPLI